MRWHKALSPASVIEQLKRRIISIQQQWRGTRRENEQLKKDNEQLRQERDKLRQENAKLKQQLEQEQRAAKRQTAPFSRRTIKPNPKPPGRKSGTAYGKHFRKSPPEQVDEVIAVPLPERCSCGGAVQPAKVESQYQQEVVRTTLWRRFDIAV